MLKLTSNEVHELLALVEKQITALKNTLNKINEFEVNIDVPAKSDQSTTSEVKTKEIIVIETMTPAEASEYLKNYGLNLSPQIIRYGIQQKVFPFGDHVQIKQHEFKIYKRLLDEWISERAVKKTI